VVPHGDDDEEEEEDEDDDLELKVEVGQGEDELAPVASSSQGKIKCVRYKKHNTTG
jgi:hypothetical protein